MAQHLTIVCPHGKQIGTCRCPAPIKAVEVSEDCPFGCEVATSDAQSVEGAVSEGSANLPGVDPRDARSREKRIEDLMESWSWLNRYLGSTEDAAFMGPLEAVLDELSALAGVRLPAIDPRSRAEIRGTTQDALRGRYRDQWSTVEAPKR